MMKADIQAWVQSKYPDGCYVLFPYPDIPNAGTTRATFFTINDRGIHDNLDLMEIPNGLVNEFREFVLQLPGIMLYNRDYGTT